MSQNLGALWALIGGQHGLNALGDGYKNAIGRFDKNYYDPYSNFGGQSLSMLANALGLNGAGGTADAMRAFQTGPGYQFQMDQGLQGLDRSAAARGMLQSGNHSADVMKFGQGLANQEFTNWISRLGGGAQMGLSAAGGQTGRQGAMANIDYGYGRDQANVWQNIGKQMGDIYGQPDQNIGQQNLFGGILGGLNLGGKLLGGLHGMGGLSGIAGLFK